MSKEILSTKGKALGEISLDEKVFGIEPNIHVMHLALRRQLNNARQGNACTKTRAEVRGGGRKPWKQKGTGRARAGSLRSPLFAGGGVSFGPKPRSYAFDMPQKARQLALRSALSARLDQTIIVKDFSEIKEAKTKLMVNGCEKNVICDFFAYNLMQARPISPSSRTVSSTFACVVPTASATALSTNLVPIPISSELHAGKTPPLSNNATLPMVSTSNFFR